MKFFVKQYKSKTADEYSIHLFQKLMTQPEQTENKEQPKQQYTPNQYRNSKDAKKLKEFMKNFSKDADVLARPCIFEQLPMLFLELDEEFNNNPLLSTQFPE